jgi:hypothetical protein
LFKNPLIACRVVHFAPNAPGRLEPSVQGHLTFTPNPLPPPLSYDPGLVGMLSEADLALGELAGVGQMLPNPHLLIRPFVRREAVTLLSEPHKHIPE